jgi:hypothetical protein
MVSGEWLFHSLHHAEPQWYASPTALGISAARVHRLMPALVHRCLTEQNDYTVSAVLHCGKEQMHKSTQIDIAVLKSVSWADLGSYHSKEFQCISLFHTCPVFAAPPLPSCNPTRISCLRLGYSVLTPCVVSLLAATALDW